MRHYTSRCNNSSTANYDVGKNNYTWTDKCLSLNPDASKFLEVRNNSRTHTNGHTIFDGNEVGTCCIQNHIVSDPYPFSDFYSAGAVQHYAQSLCSWHASSQNLEYPPK